MTENQTKFLLETFFKNEHYAGWENIARALIEEGSCIVAGETRIWVGGVGNFIKTTRPTQAVGCLLHTFDLNEFLKSAWVKDTISQHRVILEAEQKEVERRCKELSKLFELCTI